MGSEPESNNDKSLKSTLIQDAILAGGLTGIHFYSKIIFKNGFLTNDYSDIGYFLVFLVKNFIPISSWIKAI